MISSFFADNAEEIRTDSIVEIQPDQNVEQPVHNTTQGTSFFGRVWNRIKSTKPLAIATKVAAVASSVGVGLLSHFAHKHFVEHGYSVTAASGFGAGIGASAVVATGSIIWIFGGKKVALAAYDKYLYWSNELFLASSNLLLNGFLPRAAWGAWDTNNVPPEIQFGMNIYFATLSMASISLTAQAVLRRASRKYTIEDQDHISTSPVNEHAPLIPNTDLRLQVGFETPASMLSKWTVVEQIAKIAIAGSLLTGYLFKPEIRELASGSSLFFGLFGGATVSLILLNKYKKMKFTPTIDTDELNPNIETPKYVKIERQVEKILYVVGNVGLGFLFVWRSPWAFAPIGVILGVQKTLKQYQFENRVIKPHYTPFDFKRLDNIPKGLLLALIPIWFGLGLSDEGVHQIDIIKVMAMLVPIIPGYIITRIFEKHYKPGHNSKIFNAAYFYNNVVPMFFHVYMIRRQFGSMGDSNTPDSTGRFIEDVIASALLGYSWGNSRALLSINQDDATENQMPQLPPIQTQIMSPFTLTSGSFAFN